MHSDEGWKLLLLGAMLVGGFLAHISGPWIHVPRVTLLLMIGAVFGPGVLGLVPDEATTWFPFIAHLALAIIGFLLGEEFRWQEVKRKGARVLGISVGVVVVSAAMVFVAVALVSQNVVLALLLAGIAPATAPAAVFETVREGRAKGELTDTLLGVVAIDDAWGVILFSVLLVCATVVAGEGAATGQLLTGLWEIGGAVLLGVVVGLPMALISSRIRDGQITLIEAAGIVFLQSGIAITIGVSYLLAAIVLGVIVVNFSRRREAFKEIEHVREPLLAVFFILAGLKLQPAALAAVGWLGAAYVAARVAGRVAGGWVSGRVFGAPNDVTRRIGWCLTPQAGVAIGFALLAQQSLPQYGDTILSLVIATTVLFEIAGPLLTRLQLSRAGEWGATPKEASA